MKRIPVILTGILFFLSPLRSFSSETDLAEQFFQEGDWITCIQESQRVLCLSPSNENAILLRARASLRSGETNAVTGLSSLTRLASEARHIEIRAQAANEAAWILSKENHIQESWRLAEQAFLTTTNTPVFLSSGTLLAQIINRHPASVKPSDAIRIQLKTCASILTAAPPSTCFASEPTSPLSLPGQWIVTFYRSAIRPAIGARCSVSPNCSEYFLQTTRKHKLLAIPMIADRLVREPSVVSAGQLPIQIKGLTAYKDPIENHDFWMTPHP